MPTPLDRALNSKVSQSLLKDYVKIGLSVLYYILLAWCCRKVPVYFLMNLFIGFATLVTAATAWSIWGQDMFPKEPDPTGEPENWTDIEMRRWLNNRSLYADATATREELLARVKANMRAARV